MLIPHRRSLRAPLLALLLLGTLSLTDAPPTAGAQDRAASKTFELTVVGPDGKPVPQARLDIRLSPAPKQWVFPSGKLVRKSNYGALAETDDQGHATFELPTQPVHSLNIGILTPGFAPFWARWDVNDKGAVLPDQETIRLTAGVRVGGIIVDDEGRPVPNVEVHPSIEYQKREGDFRQLAIGHTEKTDAEGRWVFESVPATFETLFVGFDHPEFVGGAGQKLSVKDFTLPAGVAPTQRMTLSRGIVVTGNIIDHKGDPVGGARVRAKFLNSQRQAVANDKGEYRLSGCQPGQVSIVATAPGHGPELQSVKLALGHEPVDFVLPKGRTIRVRMVDGAGKPVPKFRVLFQDWRGSEHAYELDKVLAYAGADGVWEWREAPEDVVIADICPPEGMQLVSQRLVARDEEYLFEVKPALDVTGRVVDQETGKPVPEFRVTLGIQTERGEIQWIRRETFDGRNGAFTYGTDRPYPAFLFRIEALGYAPLETRKVAPDEGKVTLDVALKPAPALEGVVLLPDGKPAAGAMVLIGTEESDINFDNGEFEEESRCDRQKTGADGRFRLPPQAGPFELIVVHSAGLAWVQPDGEKSMEMRLAGPIRLEAWARLEGVARIGSQPAEGVEVQMAHQATVYSGNGRPRVDWSYSHVASKDGRFVWNRVVPGSGTLYRTVAYNVRPDSASYAATQQQRVKFVAGETTEVTLGGAGRAVTGKLLAPPDANERPDWNSALVSLQEVVGRAPPEPVVPAAVAGDEAKREAWLRQFLLTADGRAYLAAMEVMQEQRAQARRYAAAVAKDGTFRIEDVPAGEYELTGRVESSAPEVRRGEARRLGFLQLPVKVEGADKSPQSLGPLELKLSKKR